MYNSERWVCRDANEEGTVFEKESGTLTEIAGVLSREAAVRMVIAYGSRVRGDFREDSDLDVFVLVSEKDRRLRDRIIDVFYEYEMKSEIPFSVTILSEHEFAVNESMGSPFIKSLREEGVVFYDAQQRGEEVPLKFQA
jgi:predicted nucleotidyltransferase